MVKGQKICNLSFFDQIVSSCIRCLNLEIVSLKLPHRKHKFLRPKFIKNNHFSNFSIKEAKVRTVLLVTKVY